MKKAASLMLVLILLVSHAYAISYKTNEITEPESLTAISADRLSCVKITAEEKFLPDFKIYEDLEEIVVDKDNPYYMSEDGVLYSKDKKTLIFYPRKKSDTFFCVPGGVEYIMSEAFYKNSCLKRVSIPASVEKIGANPFSGCAYLKEIEVDPENIYFVSKDGLLYDSSMSTLYCFPAYLSRTEIPDGVKKIAYAAFAGSRMLRDVQLPDSIEKIESMAFSECISLSEITLPDHVTTLNSTCFEGCSSLLNINIQNSDYFKSADGILYSFDMLDLICCPDGKSGEITIPDGVENILNGAFDNCSQITRVILPESVKYIARAFSNCTSLLNIEFPSEQTIIEYGTLAGCSSLNWVYFPNNVVIIQPGSLPDADFKVLCDEDSFAEYYALENSLAFSYKYSVSAGGSVLSLSNQPFEKRNEIYLPVSELSEALGGSTDFFSGSFLQADIGEVSVTFEFSRVEKTVRNQTEILNIPGIIYAENDIYISAEAFSEIFDLEIRQEPFKIEIDI